MKKLLEDFQKTKMNNSIPFTEKIKTYKEYKNRILTILKFEEFYETKNFNIELDYKKIIFMLEVQVEINHEIYYEYTEEKLRRKIKKEQFIKELVHMLDETNFAYSFDNNITHIRTLKKSLEGEVFEYIRENMENRLIERFTDILVNFVDDKIGLKYNSIIDLKRDRTIDDYEERLEIIQDYKGSLVSKIQNIILNLSPEKLKEDLLKFFIQSESNTIMPIVTEMRYLSNSYSNRKKIIYLESFLIEVLYRKYKNMIYMLDDYIFLKNGEILNDPITFLKLAILFHKIGDHDNAIFYYKKVSSCLEYYKSRLDKVKEEKESVDRLMKSIKEDDITHHRNLYSELKLKDNDRSDVQAEMHKQKELFFNNLLKCYSQYICHLSEELKYYNRFTGVRIITKNLQKKCEDGKILENIAEYVDRIPDIRRLTFTKFLKNYNITTVVKKDREKKIKDIWQTLSDRIDV